MIILYKKFNTKMFTCKECGAVNKIEETKIKGKKQIKIRTLDESREDMKIANNLNEFNDSIKTKIVEKPEEEKKQRTRKKNGGKRKPKKPVIDNHIEFYLKSYSDRFEKEFQKVKIDNLLIHGYNSELKKGFILTTNINLKKNELKIEKLRNKYQIELDLINVSLL